MPPEATGVDVGVAARAGVRGRDDVACGVAPLEGVTLFSDAVLGSDTRGSGVVAPDGVAMPLLPIRSLRRRLEMPSGSHSRWYCRILDTAWAVTTANRSGHNTCASPTVGSSQETRRHADTARERRATPITAPVEESNITAVQRFEHTVDVALADEPHRLSTVAWPSQPDDDDTTKPRQTTPPPPALGTPLQTGPPH